MAMAIITLLAFGIPTLLVLGGIVIPTIGLAISVSYFKARPSRALRDVRAPSEFGYDEYLDLLEDGVGAS